MRGSGVNVEHEGPAPQATVHRRRRDDPGGPVPTIAHWPVDVGDVLEGRFGRNPWTAIVRDIIEDYRTGQADRASRLWADSIAWTIDAHGPFGGTFVGAEAVFDYHRRLERASRGTFRQRLLALESSGGPIVDAHLRTTASRGADRLELPTLIVFEFTGGLLGKVTEIPGDPAVWGRFWST
jgi:hypothetical protein